MRACLPLLFFVLLVCVRVFVWCRRLTADRLCRDPFSATPFPSPRKPSRVSLCACSRIPIHLRKLLGVVQGEPPRPPYRTQCHNLANIDELLCVAIREVYCSRGVVHSGEMLRVLLHVKVSFAGLGRVDNAKPAHDPLAMPKVSSWKEQNRNLTPHQVTLTPHHV